MKDKWGSIVLDVSEYFRVADCFSETVALDVAAVVADPRVEDVVE
jgi:hypothetical protein